MAKYLPLEQEPLAAEESPQGQILSEAPHPEAVEVAPNPWNSDDVSLPPGAYTEAFLLLIEFKVCISKPLDADEWPELLSWVFGCMIPALTMFLMSIAAQIVITYFVLQDLEQVDVCDIRTSVWIQWTGVALFAAKMLQENIETISIAYWILRSNDISRAQDGKDLQKDKPTPLTALDKIAAMVLLVIPKVAIGLWLTWVGSRFVLLSLTNTDLVLNCTAMTFVIEIDEMLHETFSHWSIKKDLELLKPVPFPFSAMDANGNRTSCIGLIDLLATTPLKLLIWGGAVLYFKMTVPQC